MKIILPNKTKIFGDFAHNADGFKFLLSSIKNYFENLVIIFGCGGNRDKTKRPEMAKISEDVCNQIYITDDNPRNEDSMNIINDIHQKAYTNGSAKFKAIKSAILNSEPESIILVAGKGHETFQNIGTENIQYF